MSTPTTARQMGALLALVLALAVLPIAQAGAQDPAAQEPSPEPAASGRVLGDIELTDTTLDPAVETSLLLSRLTFATADEAVIATSVDGADALASGALQSGAGGATATDFAGTAISGRPLFFVDPTTGPDPALFDEFERLGTSTLIVLGGEEALPQSVIDAFTAGGITDITRIGGEDRTGTAVDIATYLQGRTADISTVYLSRAFGTSTDPNTAYADASALGGLSALTGAPILLTSTNTLSEETDAFLDEGAVTNVVIIGGTAAVSASVQEAVAAKDLTVTRIEGSTRDQTAVAIAGSGGVADQSGADQFVIIEGFTGDYFTDAFSAAAYSALNDAPILLSNGNTLPDGTQTYLGTGTDPAPTTGEGGTTFALAETGTIGLCGATVSAELCSEIATDLDAELVSFTLGSTPGPLTEESTDPLVPTQVGDLEVTPQEETVVQVSVVEDRDTDEATYTASNLDPEGNYRITLVVEDNITINPPSSDEEQGDEGSGDVVVGTATFTDEDDSNPDDTTDDTNGNGQADPGPVEEIALITAVNGEGLEAPVATSPDPEDDPAAPTAHQPDEEGNLTVTVDAVDDSDGGTVYVVIHENAGESTFLEVDGAGVPTEIYGVSGAFTADATVGDLDVAPHSPETYQVDLVTGTDDEEDQRTYTVSGLSNTTAYRITLVPDENITYGENNDSASFAEGLDEEEQPSGVADSEGAENVATITEVNGTPVEEADLGGGGRTTPSAEDDPTSPTGVFPVNGTITFTIDATDSQVTTGNQGGSIRPVVYENGGESTFLEIDEAGVPTEVYGVGGLFTTTPFPT